MDLLFGGLKNLTDCVVQWCLAVLSLPLDLPVGLIALCIILGLVWFYSGVLAADIAERRGYAPHCHLPAGLLVPYLYPLILRLALKPREGSEQFVHELEKGRAEKKKAEAAALKSAEKAREEEERLADENGAGGWTKRRIERLQSEADQREGSCGFICRLTDGTEFRVKRFLPPTPETAVMEMLPENGGSPVTYRLPYARIGLIEIING